MRYFGHRRQVLLFLLAMAVPCAALLFLSFSLVRQDRELAGRRLESQRHQALEQLQQDLQLRLERLRIQEFAAAANAVDWPCPGSYRNPAVELIARVEDNRVVLPWERNRAAEAVRESFQAGEFGTHIREGIAAELGNGELDRAIVSYRRAIAAARAPARRAYAAWLEARTLSKLDRRGESVRKYRRLLDTPLDFVDEDAVPLALYAADYLLQAGSERKAALAALLTMPRQRPMLSPVACHSLSGILDRLPAAERSAVAALEATVRAQIRLMERADAFSGHYAGLGVTPDHWLVYGDEPWLVSASPAGSEEGIIALNARRVFSTVEAAWNSRHWVTIAFMPQGSGVALGVPFPGVTVSLAIADEADLLRRDRIRSGLFYSTLVLLAGTTTFGAWLLWRDLRREVGAADLRAQFVSSVSHELKTPLTAIRMFAETLQLRRSQDEATRNEYLNTIVNECVRLTRLVDDILTFSKIERGQKTFQFRPLRLEFPVRSAIRAMEYPMAQDGFELNANLTDAECRVRGDSDALEQAVLNLLSNAMKYSGSSKSIELELREERGCGVIRVTDCGVGIAPEHQARIFDKYYRAPTRENQLVSGAGLGLALVAHIVKAHGGRIDVHSAPGQGSAFEIHIPLEERT